MSRSPSPIAQVRETAQGVSLTIKKTSLAYVDEFLRLKCAPDMLTRRLFPNAKEITESFGAYEAVRKHLWKRGFDPGDPDVTAIVVGDGCTPRTGATFALRTRWDVVSIDPRMRADRDYGIDRLRIVVGQAEQHVGLLPLKGNVVVIAVHSHAPFHVIWRNLEARQLSESEVFRLAGVSIPCCIPDRMAEESLVHSYVDWRIASPERRVNIYG